MAGIKMASVDVKIRRPAHILLTLHPQFSIKSVVDYPELQPPLLHPSGYSFSQDSQSERYLFSQSNRQFSVLIESLARKQHS